MLRVGVGTGERGEEGKRIAAAVNNWNYDTRRHATARHDTTRNQQRQQRRPTDPLTLVRGGEGRRNPWAALCQRVIDFPLTLMLLPFLLFHLLLLL